MYVYATREYISLYLRNDITTVHHTARHVLAHTWVTLSHHVLWFEHSVGDLSHRELLMVSLGGGDHRRVRRQHKMDARVWHKVGLELVDIDVQSALKTEGCGQRRDHLGHQTVEVLVGGGGDTQIVLANVIDGLIIQYDIYISVL